VNVYYFIKFTNQFFFSDEIMKLIMRETGPCSGVLPVARGWKDFAPRLLYQDFLSKELPIMQRCMAARENFNVDEVRGSVGHDPFSTVEFNDVFVEVYEDFVTDGNENRHAIVFHSTVSNKYRYPGTFHVVKYSGSEVPSVPNPVVVRDQVVESNRSRHRPEVFWSTLCKTRITFFRSPGDSLSYDMGIGKILVSAMVLKAWPEMFVVALPGVDRVTSLSGEKMQLLAAKSVTGHHVLLNFFKNDFGMFETFVDNTVRDTLKCPKFPYPKESEISRLRLNHRLTFCRQYAYPGPDEDYLEGVHEMRISTAMSQRRLLPILDALSLGMNTKGANFLLKLRTLYDDSMATTNHSRDAANELTREMTDSNYELPSFLFE
jgi:hypothetical protein